MGIEFMYCLDFEVVDKIEKCLFVFGDSYAELLQEKELVKIAPSGRHKIYNAYLSNKFSFTKEGGCAQLT